MRATSLFELVQMLLDNVFVLVLTVMEKSVFVPHENRIFNIKIIKNYQNRCSLKGGGILGKK